MAGIFALQRRQARRLGLEQPRPGAIAFVQNFTAALLLHPHTHVLVPEGVFSGADKAFAFQEGAAPGLTRRQPVLAAASRRRGSEALLRKVARKVLKLARARYPDLQPAREYRRA